MNPHVVRFEGVEAKERLGIEEIEYAEGLLPSMQRREGENRMETAAVILTEKGNANWWWYQMRHVEKKT